MGQSVKSAGTMLVERLAAEHHDDLVRYIARRVRTVADARDIAQEAYVRLLRLERKDLIREPRSYLFRIAANVLYEFQLKNRADQAGLLLWRGELGPGAAGNHDPQIEMLALSRVMEAALMQLSPKCRAVLILHRRDGMTYHEIAERIGISASMVKKYLIQGLRHCREALSCEGAPQ
jgi:RNA polymerase sigma-70 factor (ECF subfamily)